MGCAPREGLGARKIDIANILVIGRKGQNDAWEQMSRGGFFNQDFLEEVESLKEEAMRYRQQLDEQGLQL